MPVDGGGGNTDDSGDDTESESDKSSNVSQPSDVALALLGGDSGGEGGLTPHGSDDEITLIPVDAGVAYVGHVDHDGGLITFPPPTPPPAPLPDPVLDGAPDWDKRNPRSQRRQQKHEMHDLFPRHRQRNPSFSVCSV